VVDDQGIYKGVVSKNRFLRTLHRTEEKIETTAEAADEKMAV
jgi:glycine betaine/proline transport system ATP-binding protein